MVNIIKKNGEILKFNADKIKKAIRKSAERVCVTLTEKDEKQVVDNVKKQLLYQETDIKVETIHNIVEVALDHVNADVAKSYREYRDNKNAFASMLDRVYSKKLSLNFVGDRSNANSDSALVTTQKAIVYNELNSELYKKFFLTLKEERAMSDGYIYIHDRGSRLDTINCCVFDMKSLLEGGFFMGNLDYQEPKSLDVAFDLIGDVTLNAASSQYGGFTIPQVDKLFAPYAEKSYKIHFDDYMKISLSKEAYEDWKAGDAKNIRRSNGEDAEKLADAYATEKVCREFEQGFQSWEMKFNSVASSRGDYPFTAMTFGLGTGKFETMCSSAALKVRKNGLGKTGLKHPVLFPKLSFFYDENLHGEGKLLEWLFDEAIDCSSKSMYPDFISLTGDGYTSETYKKYGVATSKMGCIDYVEKISVSSNSFGTNQRTMMIGEWFKHLTSKKSVNYSSNRIQRIAKHISNISDREKFLKNGYIWCDGELMNQWAKDFKTKNNRRPTRGDVFDFFGYEMQRKSVRDSRGIDSKLFDLWDSYLELKIVDILKKHGFTEQITVEQSDSDKCFIRNKFWKVSPGVYNSNTKQLDIYFPTKNIGFEIEDFATHSRVDNEPYLIHGLQRNSMAYKKGPTYFKEKQEFFKSIGIDVFEIWEDEIRNNDLKVLFDNIGILETNLKELKPVVKTIISEIHTEDLDYVDFDAKSINQYIKDIDGSFVRVKKIIKNKNVIDWLLICLSNGQQLMVTEDHPFITKEGLTLANDLKPGYSLFLENGDEIEIKEITKLQRTSNSYDVETESGTFVFSGIQSHNCRAAVSRWFERGGMCPADENDKCVMDGRFNMGAISLHFAMIAAKAKKEDKEFFEVLDYYLEMIRKIHKRTVEFLSHKKAGINPLGFCQGGFYGGHLKPDQELGEDFLKPMTISYGIMGMNEASVLLTGKRIDEDNTWAIETLKHINDYVDRIKKEDGILYAIYGTPGESLCHTLIEQFRAKYGVVKGVSDHEYTTNSFHCPVYADITPIEKQDIEYPMFHMCNGGLIQYVRYRSQYNIESIKTLVRRAMKMGFYEGINFELDWCEDCGHSFIDSDVCPKCGSEHITRIERMNGYLGFSSVRGKTMYADHKLQEFKERVSM